LKNQFDKAVIANLASEGMTVPEMAEKLGANVRDLSKFYITCFAENKNAYPLRLLVTKSWLEKELKTKTVSQICLELSTSFSVINRLIKIYGIEKKPLLKDILTPEVLYAHFVDEQLSDKEISLKYSCSIETIKKLRAKYNINYESRTDKLPSPSIDYFKRLYIDYGFTKQQMIKLLGCKPFQFTKMRDDFIASGHPLAEDIKNKSPYQAFQKIIELLFARVEPIVLYEQLQIHSLAKVAEMYDIIPPAEPGVETFSKEWLEATLKKMAVQDIIKRYHIGRTYISEMMKSENLKPVAQSDRLDGNTIKFLYIEGGWREEDIAKVFGTTKYVIISFLKRHGITAKDRKKLDEKLTEEIFYELYVKENLTLQQISKIFDVSKAAIAELKKQYGNKNSEILVHKSSGASAERFNYLMKQYKFQAFKK